jgi:hypothetical protein
MPTVSVDKMNLMRDLNRNYCKKLSYKTDISAQEDFFNLCFEYGIELEEIVGFYWEKQLTNRQRTMMNAKFTRLTFPPTGTTCFVQKGLAMLWIFM